LPEVPDREERSSSTQPTQWSAPPSERHHHAGLLQTIQNVLPGAIRAGFAEFAAFGQDAIDNNAYFAKGKLTVPVPAIGGEAAFATMMDTVMHFAATDVQEAIVPDSGHWIIEENPSATTQLVTDFLNLKLWLNSWSHRDSGRITNYQPEVIPGWKP
jgi:pimeloyl-ACP methyl ester carboxylesterase